MYISAVFSAFPLEVLLGLEALGTAIRYCIVKVISNPTYLLVMLIYRYYLILYQLNAKYIYIYIIIQIKVNAAR